MVSDYSVRSIRVVYSCPRNCEDSVFLKRDVDPTRIPKLLDETSPCCGLAVYALNVGMTELMTGVRLGNAYARPRFPAEMSLSGRCGI